MNLSSFTPTPSSTTNRTAVCEAPTQFGQEIPVGKEALLDRAYDEFCERIERGESVDPDEFCRGFPRYQSSLHRLLGAHDFVHGNPVLVGNLRPIAWPEVGQSFLTFQLVRELGRGAFARVFLARQMGMGDRFVVVKIARHGVSEAATLGRLEHPNIVQVHSHHTDAATGMTAICMPYQGSATLCDVIDLVSANGLSADSIDLLGKAINAATVREAISQDEPARIPAANYVDEVRRIALALSETLAFVHAKGILHRDLKPSNVLLSPSGRPLVLDFNLSTARRETPTLIGGTLPYMSPEQLRATVVAQPVADNHSDARSDLFSLGVILYELLTGEHPFGPVSLKLDNERLRDQLLERQQKGPQPLRLANPRVDRGFARIVEGCLAFDRNKRPESAAALADSIRDTNRLPAKAMRWAANRCWKAKAACFVFFLAAIMAGVALSVRDPFSIRQWKAGQAHYREGRFPEAVESYNRALEADPSLTAVLFDRGRARLRQGEFAVALSDFQKANGQARSGRTLACIGYCYSSLKQHSEAVIYYQQAIDAGYGTAEVYNDLGYSQSNLSKWGEAEKALTTALALNPELQAGYFNRAIVYLSLVRVKGNADLGVADVEKAIAIGPVAADLLRDAACLYASAGNPDAALDCLEQAIERGLDPSRLGKDRAFISIWNHPSFHKLSSRPVPGSGPSRTIRLLDPIKDRSD